MKAKWNTKKLFWPKNREVKSLGWFELFSWNLNLRFFSIYGSHHSYSVIFVTRALTDFHPGISTSSKSVYHFFSISKNDNRGVEMIMMLRQVRGISWLIHAACLTLPQITLQRLSHREQTRRACLSVRFLRRSKANQISWAQCNDRHCHWDDILVTRILVLLTQSIFRQQDGQMSPSCLKLIAPRIGHVC